MRITLNENDMIVTVSSPCPLHAEEARQNLHAILDITQDDCGFSDGEHTYDCHIDPEKTCGGDVLYEVLKGVAWLYDGSFEEA